MTKDFILSLNHGDEVEATIEGKKIINGIIHMRMLDGELLYYLEHDGAEESKNVFDGRHKRVFGRKNSWFFYKKNQESDNFFEYVEITRVIKVRKFLPKFKRTRAECV